MKMKRFFTLLMAIWALLSISQAVKATDYYYITGSFDQNVPWTKLDGQNMKSLGGEKYSQEYKCTTSGEYRFRFTGNDWNGTEMCPDISGFVLTEAIPSYKINHYTNEGDAYKKNYFVVNMESGKTYTFTFDNSNESNRTVACTVSGSTSSSEFEKLYLIGGLSDGGSWDESKNRPFTTTDGKIYKYVFDATYTSTFPKDYGHYYFRVMNDASQHYRPETNDALVTTTYTKAEAGNNNMAWKFVMTKGKSYTLIFDYENKQIKYSESGSEVVTKEIKLFNGSSELTGSNGKYSLNLSSAAAADATITLKIDGEEYGLADAQTIDAAGTTSDIAFTKEGTEALTLKAGFIYSLTVTEDGKMTVVAKKKSVADGYYLVGNFFEEDGDKINYDNKYFRFTKYKNDGKLSFDIPASLSIKAQVSYNGICYGPVDGDKISNKKPTAEDKSVNGGLIAGDNYWTFTDRGLEQTGIYTITITVDAAGTPTKWDVTYDNSKRMAYFLVDPTEDSDAVVHPSYAVVDKNRKCSNNYYGSIYLEKGQHCFVVGNITKYSDDNIAGNPLKTTPKLYLQGNGGLDPTKTVPDAERDKYTKVYPNKTSGFIYDETKTMVLEYNPTKGHDDVAKLDENHGIGGEILKAGTQITNNADDPITSVQIVGPGVVGSWELSAAQNMSYNKILDCWEYTFKTDKGESADNKFRFIANRGWKYNWGENSTDSKEQARIPYTDETKDGHKASLDDNNEVRFTTNGSGGSEENRNGGETYGDIIFNRPAGEWTIRLFTRTVETEDGGYVARHAYYITGSESKDIYLTYCKDKFIRTYSNDKPMDPDNDNVKIYEVYRYEKPEGGNADNIYKRGTVHLRRLKYVPANVGVVLIGEAPAGTYTDGQKVAFSLLERTEESVGPDGDYREVWTKSDDYIAAGDQWNNYLVPTVTAENDLGNVKVESGEITYRYFGLGNYYRTNYHKKLGDADTQEDYIGFFRLTANGKSGANKAYLSIPANAEVDNAVGATYGYIDYNGQLLGNDYSESNIPAQHAKMALVFDDLVDGNETTGIKELETKKMNNNKYYNLQGIEIAHPVKGIYIHNGKKVIVK